MIKDPSEEAAAADASARLDSWKEIAAYLNRGVRTVIRWEQEEGLPVHRLHHDRRGSVYAYKSELDAWQRARSDLPRINAGQEVQAGPGSRRWVALAAALAVLAAAGGALWLGGRPAEAPVRITRLTAYSGTEITPALSPDGRMVAFSWNGPGEDNFDIYVQWIGSPSPLRLSHHPGRDLSPSWSPDGRMIAFLRLNPDLTSGIYKVPSLGGAEQFLGAVQRPSNTFPLRLNWTPDSRWILAGSFMDDGRSRLLLLPAQGGESRVWTIPPPGMRDLSGSVSPDGRRMAFLRSGDGSSWRVHVVDLGPDYRPAGEVRVLGPPRYSMLAPAWSAGGRSLYFLQEKAGILSMLVADDAGRGVPRLVSSGWPANWVEASLRPEAGRAVLADGGHDLDLWRFDLSAQRPPSRIASSTVSDINPQYSPDGRRIAFASRRSGSFQIWVVEADGSNERRLTGLPSVLTGMPRWSPDGLRIAFDARVGGREGIWVVNAEGGEPRCLAEGFGTINPSWSRDGRFLYFCSRMSGRPEIWRMPASPQAPDGTPVQVTTTEGWNAFESTGGQFLYYVQKYHNGPILRIPAAGGEPEIVVPRVNVLHNFAVTDDGIYYGFAENALSNQTVRFHSFATGESTEVLNTGRRGGIGLTVAPDGGAIICTLTEPRGGDLWLVEGLREEN